MDLGQSGEGSSWSTAECKGRSCRQGSRISPASGIGGDPVEECRCSGSRVYKQSPLVVQLRGVFDPLPLVCSAWGNHRMNWRFWEKREGYTDTIINALIQAAEGSARNAHATAALESAAGLYQAAFSAAKVEPEQEALGPSFLGEAARRLIRYGQAVYLIEVEDGKIRLRDVGSWNIGGGPSEESWTYECEMAGPTKSETIRRPSSGVIHFRYAVDPLRPWEGLGPLQSASATGTLMGALEQRLGEESAAPSALLLPIPVDGGSGEDGDPLAKLKSDIAKATRPMYPCNAGHPQADTVPHMPSHDLAVSCTRPPMNSFAGPVPSRSHGRWGSSSSPLVTVA